LAFLSKLVTRPVFVDETAVRDGENYGMGRLKSISGHETDPVFALRILGVGDGIVHLHRDPESLKLAHDVDHLAVADIGNVL
jgi:hypothetical protein